MEQKKQSNKRGNPDKLQPIASKEDAKTRGRNGGIASGRAKREKKAVRECLDYFLHQVTPPQRIREALEEFGTGEYQIITHAAAIAAALINKAELGDVAAIKYVMELTGEQAAAEQAAQPLNFPPSISIRVVEGLKTTFAHSEDEIER